MNRWLITVEHYPHAKYGGKYYYEVTLDGEEPQFMMAGRCETLSELENELGTAIDINVGPCDD